MVDMAAVNAIMGIYNNRIAGEMALQRQAQLSPEATANANLTNVRAGLLPAESKSTIGLTNAQTQVQQANALQTNTETKYIGPRTLADIMATRAQAGLYGAQSGYYGAQTAGENILNKGLTTFSPRAIPSTLDQSSGNPLVDNYRRSVLGWGLPSEGGVSTPVSPLYP